MEILSDECMNAIMHTQHIDMRKISRKLGFHITVEWDGVGVVTACSLRARRWRSGGGMTLQLVTPIHANKNVITA